MCQALSQTSSRLQMAELAGDFLTSLEINEAEAAARFMIGRALPVGDEAKLTSAGAPYGGSWRKSPIRWNAVRTFLRKGSISATRWRW